MAGGYTNHGKKSKAASATRRLFLFEQLAADYLNQSEYLRLLFKFLF